jgi:hypothetical protein
MGLLYGIVVVGIVLLLALVFEALMGMRVVKFKGPQHWKIHRYLAFTIIAVGLIHGVLAIGHLIFAWF